MRTLLLLVISILTMSCSAPAQIAGGVAGATIYGSRAPGTEIEQIYYLGTFDPQNQMKPEMYRVRVHGQASAISGVKFGSGWAPAALVDSLNSSFKFDKNASTVTSEGNTLTDSLGYGRKQVLFGPEGFREAPRNHRLVIVMGSSPEDFFAAVDTVLGTVSNSEQYIREVSVDSELLAGLSAILSESRSLERLEKIVEDDIKQAS